jgi:hypothetical protein
MQTHTPEYLLCTAIGAACDLRRASTPIAAQPRAIRVVFQKLMEQCPHMILGDEDGFSIVGDDFVVTVFPIGFVLHQSKA